MPALPHGPLSSDVLACATPNSYGRGRFGRSLVEAVGGRVISRPGAAEFLADLQRRLAVFATHPSGQTPLAVKPAVPPRSSGSFEKESATICDRCGRDGVLSCTTARVPWYAVRCDECRDAGWILASERKKWRQGRHLP